MFSHINIGTNDFERSFRFYAGLMEILGHKQRFADAQKGWAGWQPAQGGRPLLLSARPFDGKPASPGNGQMVAFLAASGKIVDQAHAHAFCTGRRR